ncbi:MAG: hypothetical protein GVY16_05250 [Planctomycetes bacterium]|nr:hypothetical protein [Planctomycetota bacterium]
MSEPRPLDISLGSLVKWVLPWILGLAAFGILPTWLMTGWPGVWAQLAGVAAVLAVMMGIGILTVRAAHAGPARASSVFMGSCIARLVLCPLLFGILQLSTPLMMAPMAIWMVLAYLATLGLEVVWLIKALRTAVAEQDAERKAAEKEHPEPQDFTI